MRCDTKTTSCPVEPETALDQTSSAEAPAPAKPNGGAEAATERVRAGESKGARLVQRQNPSETGARGGSGGASPAASPEKAGAVTELASKACEVVVELGARFALARYAHIHGLKAEILGKGMAVAVCPSPSPAAPAAAPAPTSTSTGGAGGAHGS